MEEYLSKQINDVYYIPIIVKKIKDNKQKRNYYL